MQCPIWDTEQSLSPQRTENNEVKKKMQLNNSQAHAFTGIRYSVQTIERQLHYHSFVQVTLPDDT